MSAYGFPDPHTHDFTGWIRAGDYLYDGTDIISLGNPLSVESIRYSYSQGIFPWFIDGMPLPWFCPQRRAVLRFADLHISRSLGRESRRSDLTCTFDTAFQRVIKACAEIKRPDQPGTWITPDFIEVYTRGFEAGFVHSVEVWNSSGNLVGGLYGVDAGGVFCGESMFHFASNASKLALLFLIDHLAARGSTWLDAQVMTPHMKALGAIDIDRREFLAELHTAQSKHLQLF